MEEDSRRNIFLFKSSALLIFWSYNKHHCDASVCTVFLKHMDQTFPETWWCIMNSFLSPATLFYYGSITNGRFNKTPFTFLEVESCLSFPEFRNCRWLPEALNSVGQFRYIVPVALRSAGFLRLSLWNHLLCQGEPHTEDYHCVVSITLAMCPYY